MNCPLCGSSPCRRIVGQDTWSIFVCNSCTNAWTEPVPGPIPYEEKNFHGQFPYRSLGELPSQWRRALTMQADLLTRHLEAGASILEIGCGQGLFLNELQRRGFQTTGIEPSVQASDQARESGLNVITGTFPSDRLPGPFDAVVISQVLEHLPDPRRTIVELGKVAPAGLALFVQTHWRGLVPRLQQSRWYAWVPLEHFWHFTPKGLEALYRPMGWKTRALEYSSLEHGSSLTSLLATLIPGWGDQFHLLAEIPAKPQ